MKKFIASATCAFVALASVSTFVDSSKLPGLGVDIVSAASETTTTAKPKDQAELIKQLTTGIAPANLSRVLRKGATGMEVRLVQNLLVDAGYKLTADGSFGSITLSVVKTFQKDNGLKVDGLVGPLTYAKLSKSGAAVGLSRTIKYGYKGGDVKFIQTLLNNFGYKLVVDSSYGPKTQAAVKDFQKKNGLKVDGNVSTATFAKLNVAPPTQVVDPGTQTTTIKIGKAEYAAHGTSGFTVASVAMAGDKIAAAYIDEYQFMPSVDYVLVNSVVTKFTQTAVPNTAEAFKADVMVNAKDTDGTTTKQVPAVYTSKRANAAYYSAKMKNSAGATLTVDQNFTGVQAFAIGKTIKQLEDAITANTPAAGVKFDGKVDAVAGATLADTNNYLKTIVEAAKNASGNSGIEVASAKLSTLKFGKVEYAAHSTTEYTTAIVALVDDKIAGALMDEYMFMPATSALTRNNVTTTYTITGVPNQPLFANYIKDATKPVFAAKRPNAAYYTANMNKTRTLDQNFGAIQDFATGKTIKQLEDAIVANTPATGVKFDGTVDAVTGATLNSTNGYLTAILEAAKVAK